MDGVTTKTKEETTIIVTAEVNENKEDSDSEYEDKVPDWLAKAYGSQLEKKSFYDPREIVNYRSSLIS